MIDRRRALMGVPTVKADIYIASYGNDETGDGSRAHPYASLNHAVEMAKTDNTICLLTNIRMTEDIVFNSSYEAKTITIVGANRNIQLITGKYIIAVRDDRDISILGLTINPESTYISGHGNSEDYTIVFTSSGKIEIAFCTFINVRAGYWAGAVKTMQNSTYNSVVMLHDCSILNVTSHATNYQTHAIFLDGSKNIYIYNLYLSNDRDYTGYRYTSIAIGGNRQNTVRRYENCTFNTPGAGLNMGHSYSQIGDMTISKIRGTFNGSLGTYGSGNVFLTDIDMHGTLSFGASKNYYKVIGPIRGEITVTASGATDGRVLFTGYGDYQITDEDFAALSWGGDAGYHLSMESNQILIRAD